MYIIRPSEIASLVDCVDSRSHIMCFDPRCIGNFGDSATALECDLTQEQTQYKQAHSVAILVKIG